MNTLMIISFVFSVWSYHIGLDEGAASTQPTEPTTAEVVHDTAERS